MDDSTCPSQPVVEENADLESVASTRSRHSSLQGPYREPVENFFAACHPVSSARGSVESYPRSLLSTGNGYPIFKELLISTRNPAQYYRAPSVGDVGVLDSNGDFAYAFNIFTPSDNPINIRSVPPGFEPMTPPQSSAITRVPNYFPPGTIITSKGIFIDRTQDSPLEFTASTRAREGGILVLPDGATREDFTVNAEVLKYIQDNAIVWNQYVYRSIKAVTRSIPNGSLYFITGSDQAPSFSAMTIPRYPGTAGEDLELRYKHDNPKVPWLGLNNGRTSTVKPGERPGGLYSVFVRGLRISLNNFEWKRHVYVSAVLTARPYYNILTTPVVGWRSRIVRQKELRFGIDNTERAKGQMMPFHPSDLISQMILQNSPNSKIIIVDDFVWISQLDLVAGDATVPDVVRLIARVFLSHSVEYKKNVALMLHGKDASATESNPLNRILTHIYDWPTRWKLERRVTRLLRDPES